jgi:chorismate mutase / prephenate dehydrogenase
MSEIEPDIESLRRGIAESDRAIARAIGARLSLARHLGDRKSEGHEPTRDYAVEARVLERWRHELAPLGIPANRAEAIGRWLIEESVRVQEESRPRQGNRDSASAQIAVVGGSGAMGNWLVGFFEDSGHRVAIVDPRVNPSVRSTFPDVESAAAAADVLVFATPIRSTAPLLRRALATGTHALVFDVLSVKAPIVDILRSGARAGRRVTSVHPMCGPSAKTLSERNLLIVDCGVPEANRAARALFEPTALSLAEVELNRHDALIAESLGLAHAVNLLFLAALSADPASPRELAAAASTTFHRQSSLAGAVAAEGPELYLDIQALNPHSWSVYEELRGALDRLSDIVERRDLQAFTELLKSGAAKLGSTPGPMRS